MEGARLLFYLFAGAGVGRLVWIGGRVYQKILSIEARQEATNGAIQAAVDLRRKIVERNDREHKEHLALINSLTVKISGLPCLGLKKPEDCG
jgi:hypothetical protein